MIVIDVELMVLVVRMVVVEVVLVIVKLLVERGGRLSRSVSDVLY